MIASPGKLGLFYEQKNLIKVPYC